MAETLRRPCRPISEGLGMAYRQHRILVGVGEVLGEVEIGSVHCAQNHRQEV